VRKLKAQAQEEFTRHQLLETQRPVAFSDHTRGIGSMRRYTAGFARLKRRKFGIDSLASRAACGVRMYFTIPCIFVLSAVNALRYPWNLPMRWEYQGTHDVNSGSTQAAISIHGLTKRYGSSPPSAISP